MEETLHQLIGKKNSPYRQGLKQCQVVVWDF